MSFLFGTPGSFEQRSRLGPEQQNLYSQMLAALQQRGAGGAFGSAADYYRNILGNDEESFNEFANPELRRFREDIIPGLSEQFAGMGSGALSSSGFRNAAVNAGTDLSERLGAMRAQLRNQAAQGLASLGQFGLGQFNENLYRKGRPGLIDSLSTGLGSALGAFGGPALNAAGGAVGNAFGSWIGQKLGPYGNPQPSNSNRAGGM